MKYAIKTLSLTKKYLDFLAVDALNMKIDIPINVVEENHNPILDITRIIIEKIGTAKAKMRCSHF